MNLKLEKPIAFFDLETTGVVIGQDRIVEIAILKLLPDGKRETKHFYVNPEMKIPAEATALHGITDEKVKDAPTFKKIANEIKQFIENCDLGGYNSNKFDIPLLVEEFLRVGITVDLTQNRMIDVQHIFYKMEPRTLSAAYKFYCGKDLDNAHSAMADIEATVEVLLAQIERYNILGNTVDSVLNEIGQEKIVDYARRLIYNEKDEIIFNFGKHKGKTVYEVFNNDSGYYDWMQKGDFAKHTKLKLTELYNKFKLNKK